MSRFEGFVTHGQTSGHETSRVCTLPGGVEPSTDPEHLAESEEDPSELDQMRHAVWRQATGQRAAKLHASARREELKMHVHAPLYEPNGHARVDRIARHVLHAPPPATSVIELAAMEVSMPEDECMQCEECDE